MDPHHHMTYAIAHARKNEIDALFDAGDAYQRYYKGLTPSF